MRRHQHNAHPSAHSATTRHASAPHHSPAQRLYEIAALVLGAAPIGFGVFRAWQTDTTDYRIFWMAVAASLFAGGTLLAAIGRRRSRHAVKVQGIVIFIVSTLLAAAAAYLFGATAWIGIWAVAVVFGGCLSAASLLIEVARPAKH